VPVSPVDRSSPATSWISNSLDWINVVQVLTRRATETDELSVSDSSDTAHISARLTLLLLRVSVSRVTCAPGPFPSANSSRTCAHRCTTHEIQPAFGYLGEIDVSKCNSVSDSRDSACDPAPCPSPRSSLTHAHRCISSRPPTDHLGTSAGLMCVSVCDNRDITCELASSPSPRSASSHSSLRPVWETKFQGE